MLESLPEVSGPLKVFLVLVFVLALIGVIAWLLRRFGAERFGGSSVRGRQPRLAVVDAAPVGDGRRKLIIIRRDNVEHLLMIGGPTDVVVEQNIVRAMGAPRDKTAEPNLGRGLSVSETLTRPVPLGEGTMWPLQPQTETNGRTPRTIPEEPVQWTWPTHPEPQRPSRPESRPEKLDTPPNQPDELSTRSAPREPHAPRPVMAPPVSRPTPTPPAAAPAEKVVEKVERISAPAEPDRNLAEMANRLEPSLRRPAEPRVAAEISMAVKTEPMAPPPLRVTPESRIAPPEPRITPPEQKPARTEAKPKAVFESLEEEMASLLGRPPGKT